MTAPGNDTLPALISGVVVAAMCLAGFLLAQNAEGPGVVPPNGSIDVDLEGDAPVAWSVARLRACARDAAGRRLGSSDRPVAVALRADDGHLLERKATDDACAEDIGSDACHDQMNRDGIGVIFVSFTGGQECSTVWYRAPSTAGRKHIRATSGTEKDDLEIEVRPEPEDPPEGGAAADPATTPSRVADEG